jgi:predicted transcriptional regulator of viral defense system
VRVRVDAAAIAFFGPVLRQKSGKRAFGTSGTDNEDFRWEDLMSATQATKNGVICLTSALAIYGLTEEIPRQHWIAIRNSTRHRAASSTKVIRMRNIELGKTTIKMSGLTLPIFDRERTIIDSFRYLGVETALKALKAALSKKGAEKIDPEKLRNYSKKLRFDIEPYLLAVTYE